MPHLTRRAATLLGAAAGSALLLGRRAWAEEFHGFDPANFDGSMLSADDLRAMVKDAASVTKPHNGKQFVIGFANLQRDIAFCIKVEDGIKQNAAAAGVELVVADNHLDGATALANAESFLRRQVDYVIEFQTDAAFGATIMAKMNDAGTKVVAIDIPMPGATFFGVNNPRAGFMAGAYLAQAATAKFGADRVRHGYLVVGELPQSGAIPAMRTGGEEAGFRRSVPGFDAAHVIKIDTKNTLQESFSQMSNVIGRIPPGAAIMLTAINDQATLGMLRATKQAGRGADAIAVGMGADETEALAKEDGFVASVGSFPGTLRQLPDPDCPDAAGRQDGAAGGAGASCHGDEGECLQILPEAAMCDGSRHRLQVPRRRVQDLSGRAATVSGAEGLHQPDPDRLRP